MIRKRLLLYLLCWLAVPGCTAPVVPDPIPTGSPPAVTRSAAASPTPALPPTAPVRLIPLEPEALEGVAIAFWHVWDGARGELIAGLVEDFNRGNPYGVVVAETRHENLHGRVASALQTGGAPHIAVGFNYHAAAWEAVSPLLDLVPYATDPEWGYPVEALNDFHRPFWTQASAGQRQTGLPYYRTAEVLFYNRTWAAELGFSESPKTPEALREQACAANAALRADPDLGNDGDGGLILGFEPGGLAAWLYAFGGGLQPLQEGEAYTLDRPENVQAMTFLRTLLDEGCARVSKDVYPHAAFSARLGLFLPGTLAGAGPQQAAMEAAGSTDEWVALPYPSVSGVPAALVSGPDLVLFPSGEAEQLAAWVFARWLTEPEQLARWVEAAGYFPGRLSALDLLDPVPEALQTARIEAGVMFPRLASWPAVQWVLSDAAQVLYAPLTTLADVPALAAELDAFAEEVARLAP